MPSLGVTRNLVEADGIGNATIGSSTLVTASSQSGNTGFHNVKLLLGGTLTTTANGTNGSTASGLLFTAPPGVVWLHPGGGSLALSRAGTNATSITTAAAAVVALGTSQPGTDNATLTSTEANVIPSTAFTFSSGATSNTLTPTTSNIVDGGTAGTSVYLNVAIPAANATGTSAVSVSGYVAVSYVRPGELG